MIDMVDKLYMDQMTSRRPKKSKKKMSKSMAASTVGSTIGSVKGSTSRKASVYKDDRPKIFKPMRKTLLNSELMMDQIKNLAYSEKDTYNYWIKEIEESEELKQQYMEMFGTNEDEMDEREQEKAAQKAYQLEMK